MVRLTGRITGVVPQNAHAFQHESEDNWVDGNGAYDFPVPGNRGPWALIEAAEGVSHGFLLDGKRRDFVLNGNKLVPIPCPDERRPGHAWGVIRGLVPQTIHFFFHTDEDVGVVGPDHPEGAGHYDAEVSFDLAEGVYGILETDEAVSHGFVMDGNPRDFRLLGGSLVQAGAVGPAPAMGIRRQGTTLVGDGLIKGCLIGVEVLGTLSWTHHDPVASVRATADYGFDFFRTFTTLSRPPRGPDPDADAPKPPPGWFLSMWADKSGNVNPAWIAARDAWMAECRATGVYACLCAYDEPSRTDRAKWDPNGNPGAFPSSQNSWNGQKPGKVLAERLFNNFMAGIVDVANLHPEFIGEVCNEPPRGDATWWIPVGFSTVRNSFRAIGTPVVMVDSRPNDSGSYAGDVVADHFYPEYGDNRPNWNCMRSIKTFNGQYHVMTSTDGAGVGRWDDKPGSIETVIDRCLAENYSFALCLANPMDALAEQEKRVVERMANQIAKRR